MTENPSCGPCLATIEDFSRLVGESFRVHAAPSTLVEATLASAEKIGVGGAMRGKAGEREPFSLVFYVPAVSRLPQRMYRIEHPSLGTMDVFLVPVALDARGLCLQAVFN